MPVHSRQPAGSPFAAHLIAYASCLFALLPASVYAETPAEHFSLESGVQEAPPDEMSTAMDEFIAALRTRDAAEIRSLLSPSMLARTERELGEKAIDSIINQRFIPYFSDLASLDPTVNSVRTKDAGGHEGLAFFRSFIAKDGTERPFVVYVLKEGERYVIGNLELNKRMSSQAH